MDRIGENSLRGAMLLEYMGRAPRVHPGAFLAEGCVLVGDVTVEEHASVLHNAVLRGDINSVRVGRMSNVQDNCVFHVSDDFACVIGERVTVGHGVILHACAIGDDTTVGMGSIVMNGAEVGAGSIVAAGALIPPGRKFPPRSLIMGFPAKVEREVTDAEVEANVKMAQKYRRVTENHRRSRRVPQGAP
ncbi:MAG: gamma carbonic anhydrase family protein [bacterium]